MTNLRPRHSSGPSTMWDLPWSPQNIFQARSAVNSPMTWRWGSISGRRRAATRWAERSRMVTHTTFQFRFSDCFMPAHPALAEFLARGVHEPKGAVCHDRQQRVSLINVQQEVRGLEERGNLGCIKLYPNTGSGHVGYSSSIMNAAHNTGSVRCTSVIQSQFSDTKRQHPGHFGLTHKLKKEIGKMPPSPLDTRPPAMIATNAILRQNIYYATYPQHFMDHLSTLTARGNLSQGSN